MPYQRVFSSFAAVGGAPVNAAETVVGTSPPVSTSGAGAQAKIAFDGVCTPGTSATSLVIKIERGTAAGGTQVGATKTIVCSAGNAIGFHIEADDIIGEVAGQQWVCTILQTAGAANGSTAAVACRVITD